jgi:hypothetical protein
VARIDDDGSLDISFEEWRDYLMFHPRYNTVHFAFLILVYERNVNDAIHICFVHLSV